jgi:hypothetical protein
MGEVVERAIAALNVEKVREEYWAQNEFIFLREFLPGEVVGELLTPEVERLRPLLNRNYIPMHKKGGSVSYFTIREQAPVFLDFYRSPAFREFLCRVVDADLVLCPDADPHSCALYYYTEPGDHIGFHYDTSYYKGARYTVLLGLINQSTQCKLACHLHKDDPARAVKELELLTEPGDLAIFNGDKLWHAVTPLGEDEYRVMLTLEYVTNPEMGPFKRVYSNLKDAFAYFGLRAFLKRG